jgi:hypothetical protein
LNLSLITEPSCLRPDLEVDGAPIAAALGAMIAHDDVALVDPQEIPQMIPL